LKLTFTDLGGAAAIHITRFSRRFGISIVERVGKPSRKMIVVGDGTPDYEVLAVVCHHMDGEHSAYLVKPEKTGLGAVDSLKLYAETFKDIAAFLFLIDQEYDELEELFAKVEQKSREVGMELSAVNRVARRVGVSECRLGGRSFALVVAVNGLDHIQSHRHTIEDHLVAAAGLAVDRDPKSIWMSLSSEEHRRVFEGLIKSPQHANNHLPQQFQALQLLMDHPE